MLYIVLGLGNTMISVTRFLPSSDPKTSGGGEYVNRYTRQCDKWDKASVRKC